MKAYATVSKGLDEIDTFSLKGETIEEVSRKTETALIRFDINCEFAYTVYDAPRGIQHPVSSRRGHIADIIGDIVAERA